MDIGELRADAKRITENIDAHVNKLFQLVENAVSFLDAERERFANIDWKKIGETLGEIFYFTNFMVSLHAIEFPPCFHFNTEGVIEIISSLLETSDREASVNLILNKYNDAKISLILHGWETSQGADTERMPLLREAMDNYRARRYYSCTALLVCQYSNAIEKNEGIVKAEMSSNAKIRERVELLRTELNDYRNRENKNPVPIKFDSDRNRIFRHLDVHKNLISVLVREYIDNFVYGSKHMGNHPNRNKICHGEKQDFGTQETALKAIICMDIMLRYPKLFESITMLEEYTPIEVSKS